VIAVSDSETNSNIDAFAKQAANVEHAAAETRKQTECDVCAAATHAAASCSNVVVCG
jgi:hypothetical protein